MTIEQLLCWPTRDGSARACRLLDRLPHPTRVNGSRPVGRLTARERRVIAAALTSPQAVIDLTYELEAAA
ncbi:MAG: hypothetical protein Q8O56_06320 [Solirubrobacteraceae bacterium]|nr:hypothetical protein [Solirubrobacteraceae bacterium]